VPITPTMSVIISKPSSYTTEPRLSTLVITDREVEDCNHGVQTYSQGSLFYRLDRPTLTKEFTCGQHLQYDSLNNPLDRLINSIPGVSARNQTLRFLL